MGDIVSGDKPIVEENIKRKNLNTPSKTDTEETPMNHLKKSLLPEVVTTLTDASQIETGDKKLVYKEHYYTCIFLI